MYNVSFMCACNFMSPPHTPHTTPPPTPHIPPHTSQHRFTAASRLSVTCTVRGLFTMTWDPTCGVMASLRGKYVVTWVWPRYSEIQRSEVMSMFRSMIAFGQILYDLSLTSHNYMYIFIYCIVGHFLHLAQQKIMFVLFNIRLSMLGNHTHWYACEQCMGVYSSLNALPSKNLKFNLHTWRTFPTIIIRVVIV